MRDDAANYESAENELTKYDKVVKLGTTKSRLYIDCVRPSDAGVYTCVAETPTLRIVTSVVLQVGKQLFPSRSTLMGTGRYVGFTPMWEGTICGFLDPFALRRRRFGAL